MRAAAADGFPRRSLCRASRTHTRTRAILHRRGICVARPRANVRMYPECEYRSEHRSDARHLPSNGFHSFFSLSCHPSPSSSASSPTRTPKASLGVFSRAEPRKNAFIHSSFSTRYGNAIEYAHRSGPNLSHRAACVVVRSFSVSEFIHHKATLLSATIARLAYLISDKHDPSDKYFTQNY